MVLLSGLESGTERTNPLSTSLELTVFGIKITVYEAALIRFERVEVGISLSNSSPLCLVAVLRNSYPCQLIIV